MESVSSIHNRWSFTRLNPSSIKISFIISIAGTAFLILVARVWIYKQDGELLYTLLFGLPSMVGLAFFDFWSLQELLSINYQRFFMYLLFQMFYGLYSSVRLAFIYLVREREFASIGT